MPQSDKCSHGKDWATPCLQCELVSLKEFVGRWDRLVVEAKARIAELEPQAASAQQDEHSGKGISIWLEDLRRAHEYLDAGKPFFTGKDCAELADLLESLARSTKAAQQDEREAESVIGVGDGSGNLFVRGPHEAIMRVRSFIFDAEKWRAQQVQADPIRAVVQAAVDLMEAREWAEHFAECHAPGDQLALRLEACITDLHNEAYGGEDRQVQADAGAVVPMRDALEKIKAMVCGDRYPRWAQLANIQHSRGQIADLCDIALASHPSPAAESDKRADAALLDWLMHNIGGNALRAIGVITSAGCDRDAIRAAMSREQSGGDRG